jgi:succinate dehydrogenase/fumarate reductase cytochrome b subunit
VSIRIARQNKTSNNPLRLTQHGDESMNCRQTRQALDRLLGEGTISQLSCELEKHLQDCTECRDWYHTECLVVEGLKRSQDAPVPSNLARRVLNQLPSVTPGTIDRVKRLVIRAWEEPEFRETLRADPNQTLRNQGVNLPADVHVVVVAPSEATLPTKRSLTLPLPGPGEGARSEEDLRLRMRHTAASVLFEPELLASVPDFEGIGLELRLEALLAEMQQNWESFFHSVTHTPPQRMLVTAVAVAASLFLLLGLSYVLQDATASSTPGAAVGSWSWAAGGVLLGVVGLAAILFLWRTKGR